MSAPIEKMGGATPVWLTAAQVAAFRSLAASRGIEFAVVAQAAADDDLRRIIELRDLGKERRVTEQIVARTNAIYRLRVLALWQERDLWLRDRGV